MRLRSPATSTAATATFFATVCRHFSAASKRPTLPNIHSKYKSQALSDAEKALTDYLHTTRSLPYAYAEYISKNSPFLLSAITSQLRFVPSTFPRALQKFLSYNPINEFEFFFESIGIDPLQIRHFLPPRKFFFSEDPCVFHAACALSDFGFPWKMLGKLYVEEPSIFRTRGKDLTARVYGLKALGFNTVSVVGICLAFPYLLKEERGLGGEIDALCDDLKRVFIDFDLTGSVRENVDAWYEVCRKIRVFYHFGCEKGKIGDLMGRNKHILLCYSEEVLVKKAKFFCRLNARERNAGLLLLEKPEILNFDLESRTVSVLGLLKHFGFNEKELKSVAQDYQYVFGRNKIANLPHVMRALNLHEWFFDKIRNEDHNLLSDCSVSNPHEDIDKDFVDCLERIHSSRTPHHNISKLNFLLEIGFGENSLTTKLLSNLHGTSCELQERFDCLLRTGFEFSMLCKMIALAPKIINQRPPTIENKVDFLRQDMGVSMQTLEDFPGCLCFHLEDRIKPRHRFHMWLAQKGLDAKQYTLSSIIATSERNFIARLYNIHPALPKHWLECFVSRGAE